MRYFIYNDEFENVQETFRIAKKCLHNDGAQIWQLFLIYLKTTSGLDPRAEADRLVTEIAPMCSKGFDKFKVQVIEMMATMYSIRKARTTYELFIKNQPKCYPVHDKMIDLESKQVRLHCHN